VQLGDRVFVRYWLFFKGHGIVTYVPGQSPLKRDLERDGLAWVRARLEGGTLVDTIVIDGVLKKSTSLVARGVPTGTQEGRERVRPDTGDRVRDLRGDD
jgi:hypothetical protein